MARGAQAAIAAGIAVFGFDADPGLPPSRALQVLTRAPRPAPRRASRRANASPPRRPGWQHSAGVDLAVKRGGRSDRLHLVDIDDDPGRGARTVTAWYYATAPLGRGGRARVLVGDRAGPAARRQGQRGAAPGHRAPPPGRPPGRRRGRAPRATSSRATTCSASTWRCTAAPRAATARSGVASRSCATVACCGPSPSARSPPLRAARPALPLPGRDRRPAARALPLRGHRRRERAAGVPAGAPRRLNRAVSRRRPPRPPRRC